MLLAWLATLTWAALDEYRQSFSPSRTASFDDVLLDAYGALAGLFLYRWTIRKWSRRPTLND